MPVDVRVEPIQVYHLPGEAVFPESVGVDPQSGDAYVGSLADGTLYRLPGAAGGKAEVWSPAREGGRAQVAGVKVDDGGRLWAAGAYDGTLYVYDLASRALLARLDVAEHPSCVNDIAFSDGAAYVTDSFVPKLFRVSCDQLAFETWSDLAAQGVPWADGLNLNGIVTTPDGRYLVACQTNLGRFWRFSLADGTADEVVLDGGPLPHCDGLARIGNTLVVAVNARDLLAVVDLADDGATGTVQALVTCDAFAFPTSIAADGERLLVLNSQLNKMGGKPRLPFTAVVVPAAALANGGAEEARR